MIHRKGNSTKVPLSVDYLAFYSVPVSSEIYHLLHKDTKGSVGNITTASSFIIINKTLK